ncbi:hypothetical protein ACSFCW_07610 [Yokenella regensburgei]|uniref:hypothetical protein n=1 Tax=Yokenella regensburgei TaxID=158877 RepID=UPI003EDA0888
MSYSDIVATIAMIVSITAVPASGYLSYRYAIKGEKRKEWNQIVSPIRDKLIRQIDAIGRGEYFYVEINRGEILSLGDLKKRKERNELLAAFDSFERAHSFEELWEVSPGRQMVTGDTSNALAASISLLNLVQRK